MSQGMALGITVGSSNTVAVTSSGGQRQLNIRPSTLGTEELPESFLSRVGDPVDIRLRDGSAVRAADLVAAAVGRAVDDTGPAAAMVACYPAWWSQHTVEIQRTALAAIGLDGVALVPEPTAAMRWLQEVHESTHDGAMVVYDLGATGLTVSVARTGALSGLLGEPVRSTTVAGAEFDLLTMRYVLAYAVGEKDFDPFDPLVEQELAALRGRCAIAKETLSKNTATVVPVRLPDLGAVDVRLVRDEVEDLYRGPLLGSTDLVREAVRRAGLNVTELDGILLTGGGAAIPLVTEILSTEFGIPVAAAADPAHLSAHGAALLAADLLADSTPTEPHPALADTPAQPISAPDPDRAPASRNIEHSLVAEHAAVRPRPRRISAPPRRIPRDSLGGDVTASANTGGAERVPLLPELPSPEQPASGFAHWRRVAVLGAVAVAVAALATGTLAMGTGVQSAPSDPAAPHASATPAAALDTPEGPVATNGKTAPIGHPVTTTPAHAGATTTAGTPGLSDPDPSAPPGSVESPTPQPNTAAPAQLPSIQQPALPTVPPLPTQPLADAVDQFGNAVPKVPSQIIPHTGG